MAFDPEPWTGALFPNKKKDDEKQPDYTGNVFIGTTEYRVAGWKREDRNGNAFLSLALDTPRRKRRDESDESVKQGEQVPF